MFPGRCALPWYDSSNHVADIAVSRPKEIELADGQFELSGDGSVLIDRLAGGITGRLGHHGSDGRQVVVCHTRCADANDQPVLLVDGKAPDDVGDRRGGVAIILATEQKSGLVPADLADGNTPAQRLAGQRIEARRPDVERWHGRAETLATYDVRDAEPAFIVQGVRVVRRAGDHGRIREDLRELHPRRRLFQRAGGRKFRLDFDRELGGNGWRSDLLHELLRGRICNPEQRGKHVDGRRRQIFDRVDRMAVTSSGGSC